LHNLVKFVIGKMDSIGGMWSFNKVHGFVQWSKIERILIAQSAHYHKLTTHLQTCMCKSLTISISNMYCVQAKRGWAWRVVVWDLWWLGHVIFHDRV
jgi:hypothetical protein